VITNHSDGSHVDLRYVHLDSYGDLNTVAEAVRRFDARTAEFVRASTGNIPKIVIFPVADRPELPDFPSLCGLSPEYNTGVLNWPSRRCLAALAYLEFFPYDQTAKGDGTEKNPGLRRMVSEAILASIPGYCGTFAAPAEISFLGLIDLLAQGDAGGNYDLAQMHLLQIAYRYYDELSPPAQEFLINVLLATGRIHRIGEDDIVTSGGVPNDWSRAGTITFIIHIARIGETENHILQIHTARYLTNQLLYQRDHDPNHDNRRNGSDDAPTCTNLLLDLLRNFLKDDFSEYNAKSYQTETRNALRNLCSYAYDHQVRLGARMVLDYISAHVAVSSCDLRRMVPFRRINGGTNTTLIDGYRLDISLLEWETGADRASEPFVVQAGNTRAYETNPATGPSWASHVRREHPWSIRGEGQDGMMEGLGNYRLPAPIHDLFINDMHRRFYQRLHRTDTGDERTGQNADNVEVYAGSPSYLITAGGGLAGWAINPGIAAVTSPSVGRKQLGVAMTTSFMPTGQSAGPNTQNYAKDLIQFSSFAERGNNPLGNYGVAPDFACGHWVLLPDWCQQAIDHTRDKRNANGVFSFVDKKFRKDGERDTGPGFFLAIYQDSQNQFAVMEAYDTWLHPELEFEEFVTMVWEKNQNLHLQNHVQSSYITTNGNQVGFVIWFDFNGDNVEDNSFGSDITSMTYGDDPKDANDRIGDASKSSGFVNGTILNNPVEGVVVITNPLLNQQIILDWSDPKVLRRTSETGEVEEARENGDSEIWVDFDWSGDEEGDFFHPFKTIAGAAAAVSDGGVIKILPGSTHERPFISSQKRIRFEAAIGGVTIGIG
jgi:hypothetical protein